MSESRVTQYVVHSETDERVRCTRAGALAILEAEIVVLVDETRGYRKCIKGKDALEAIIDSGQPQRLRMLTVAVDSWTDDPERMVAAAQACAEQNPTGRPPWVLPAE